MSFFEEACQAVHAAGGRMTHQRQVIIELFEDTTEQVDAEALYWLARRQDPDINLTTVYRTLDVLEAAGLIRPHYISPEHDRKYYSRIAGPYHFTCRQCHRVFSFTSSFVEELKRQLERDLHVQSFNACVCVDGLCPDCQVQATAPQEEH
jgi:Fe2+ or Zn2+ uptake regulation protein